MAVGDGPIDAAFTAIDRIIGKDLDLDSFELGAVTGGEDAQGEATVKMSMDGQHWNGRGLSTDIVEASIMAYIAAINSMEWELSAVHGHQGVDVAAISAARARRRQGRRWCLSLPFVPQVEILTRPCATGRRARASASPSRTSSTSSRPSTSSASTSSRRATPARTPRTSSSSGRPRGLEPQARRRSPPSAPRGARASRCEDDEGLASLLRRGHRRSS